MASSKTTLNFEESLQDIETIVKRLETGQISLEDSLLLFEKGVKLTRTCQEALHKAEQKVQMLIEKNGELQTEPFVVEE